MKRISLLVIAISVLGLLDVTAKNSTTVSEIEDEMSAEDDVAYNTTDTRPTTENVTVISGTMNFGLGNTFVETGGRAVQAGGFASMPAGMNNFARATGETVVQFHGMGPFEINYRHPEDDPRTRRVKARAPAR